MGKEDLLNTEDFFSEFKKTDQEPKKDQQPSPEKQKETDIFQEPEPAQQEDQTEKIEIPPEPYSEEEISPFTEELSQDFHGDLQESLEMDKAEELPEPDLPAEEPSPAPQKQPIDYIDEKQEKLSYKPFFIGGGIIVVLVILFIVLKSWLFSPSEQIETPVVSEEPAMEEPKAEDQQAAKRAAFFAGLAAQTSHAASTVSGLVTSASKSNNVSSALLYGDEVLFEVFSSSRDDLARLNIKLKETFKNKKLDVVSTSQRPGTSGGVFGLYSLRLNGKGQAGGQAAGASLNSSQDAEAWIRSLAKQNSLRGPQISTRPVVSEEMFKVVMLEATMSGSQQNCLKMLSDIGSSARNLAIHKLTFNAVDQTGFNKANYQLRLVLKLYM